MRRHGTFAALFGLAMLVAASNAAAGDDKTEDARAYFNRGVESFREGAYDAALVQFKAAYATAPNYRVLYNVGQTSLKLQDFAAALAAFERYLAEGGTDLPSDRRAAVEQEIERLAGRVSRVTIVSNAAGGEILVDDVAVGRLPLPEGVRVSAGRRKLTIVPDGGAPISRVVDVPGGTPVRVELSVARAPETRPQPAPSAPPPPVAPAETTPGDRTGAWVALGGGAVLAVGAGVAGILALGAKSDADAELARYPASRKDLDDARSRMKSTALIADVLGLAALVSGGVGVTLLLINRSPGPRTSAPNVEAELGPGQLRLRTRF